MRIFGNSNEIQRILYEHKYGDWYFENEFYLEQFLNLKQKDLTVDEYTCQPRELQDVNYRRARYNLVHYVRGLPLNILENMNHCHTSQEAYFEAFLVEHMLRQSRMQQS